MNIFEDLIEELKEENLLEETPADTKTADTAAKPPAEKITASAQPAQTPAAKTDEPKKETSGFDRQTPENNFQKPASAPNPPVGEADYYRKRAVEEVAFLQMVEHVFAGVEREQMKIAPKPYDDLEVKKVLHSFLQISGDVKSPEHAQLEFRLLQETESWYSALSQRDKLVSVAHLRRYCETTRPALSSPALVALGRFYRNSPYSEQIRSKFDLVLTRLFTKEIGGEKRKPVFSRDELIKHLNELYADWSSIPLYSTDEENSDTLLMVLKFEDFIAEAENAESFDELIRNDFFNRLRRFKESANEHFFAPLVTAAAIESNLRIGNRYVELLAKEREKGEAAKLEDKYGFLHDQVISDATSKTLQLVELLRQRNETVVERVEPAVKKAEPPKAEPKQKTETAKTTGKKEKSGFSGVNKWLLAATILSIVLSIGLYFWAEQQDEIGGVFQNAQKVNLDNSSLKEYVKEARISDETFYGVVLPSWSGLTRDKKEEILKKIAKVGADKGFKSVHLLDREGKTVGAVSNDNVTIRN